MNNTRKSQLIGYLFLIGATILEIILLTSIFDIELFSAKMLGIILTPATFNFAIWCLAIRYNMTREHCEKESRDGSAV